MDKQELLSIFLSRGEKIVQKQRLKYAQTGMFASVKSMAERLMHVEELQQRLTHLIDDIKSENSIDMDLDIFKNSVNKLMRKYIKEEK